MSFPSDLLFILSPLEHKERLLEVMCHVECPQCILIYSEERDLRPNTECGFIGPCQGASQMSLQLRALFQVWPDLAILPSSLQLALGT